MRGPFGVASGGAEEARKSSSGHYGRNPDGHSDAAWTAWPDLRLKADPLIDTFHTGPHSFRDEGRRPKGFRRGCDGYITSD